MASNVHLSCIPDWERHTDTLTHTRARTHTFPVLLAVWISCINALTAFHCTDGAIIQIYICTCLLDRKECTSQVAVVAKIVATFHQVVVIEANTVKRSFETPYLEKLVLKINVATICATFFLFIYFIEMLLLMWLH